METIGSRISAFREALNLKQADIFRAAGIKQQTLSSIESGTEPKSGVIAALLAAYPQISPDWLLTGKGEMLREGAAKEPMLSGGTLTEGGGTARKRGSRPHIDFEDADQPVNQKTSVGTALATQTDAEFRDMLIGRINELKAQNARLESQLETKDQAYNKLHRVLERLQDSYSIMETELQEARAELRGKEHGNQYLAPGDSLSAAAEPITPIGFKPVVRAMWVLDAASVEEEAMLAA
ncbi:helix-turn-helix domain-containing protein [Hymenobacter sp. BT175]|uniref:helix-turn-helix domain-containing protein n=1 Tax=Hymenobacter translucens TaxID=2886507 RepID=UPI001D0F37A4|nr:helix-turn-helix transcriptional regulator [Hymenobacter translucens]MCC2547677.1 helix-turn-helix domain-containing protein [Hymenobacter translucens]